MMSEKKIFRQKLRAKRNQLSLAERHAKSHSASNHFIHSTLFTQSQHIACYLTQDAEVETTLLLNALCEHKKKCYLPVLQNNHMVFVRYQLGDTLTKNRLGIPEPDPNCHEHSLPQALDVVIMPLVGFDLTGQRLGMGGGFYDKTLTGTQPGEKPLRVGLAFECQRVAKLPAESWDVPLDFIVTEEGVFDFG